MAAALKRKILDRADGRPRLYIRMDGDRVFWRSHPTMAAEHEELTIGAAVIKGLADYTDAAVIIWEGDRDA